MKWIPIGMFFLFCVFGVSGYELWGQVVYLWESKVGISKLLFHPHGMRFLLVLPIFVVSDWLAISYNWLFSCVMPLIITVTSFFIGSTVEWINHGLSRKKKKTLFFYISLSLILLSMFMNGRIMFAVMGSSIILNIFVKWDRKSFFGILIPGLISMFLCSVSSGTFIVAFLSFYTFLVFKYIQSYWCSRKNLELFFVFFAILIVVLPLLKVLALKNVNYYGGGLAGFFNMMNHGLGSVFLNIDSLHLYLRSLVAFCCFWLLFLWLPHCRKIWTPLFLIVFSMIGGLFGISTMMLVIPPLIVIFCITIINFRTYLLPSIRKQS